jgi:hypothetical protein
MVRKSLLTVGSLSVNCALWKDEPGMVGPVVQVTDLVHAIGIAITPQILAPLLHTSNPTVSPLNTTDSSVTIHHDTTTSLISSRPTGIQPVQVRIERLICHFYVLCNVTKL